ncbi:MAG: transposase [Gemmatimonas sp. SM23_52]|nr:MAG: transposase [Gemmatimonas sp. SM23_52]
MNKTYVVELTQRERAQLLDLLRKGKARARKLRRAHILLLAHDGQTDETIARTLHLGRSTVERTRRKCVEGGLEWALNDRHRPGQPRKLDGKQEAVLVALACSDPPQGRTRWTLRLLAGRLVELGVVEEISHETVRRVLKKTTRNPGRRSTGASPR